MDKAVQDGKATPGQYLVLKFDFSKIVHSHDIRTATKNLTRNINSSLVDFTDEYAKHLGESFASRTSQHFNSSDPSGNLGHYVGAVNTALRRIREASNKNHPLFGIKGVCHSRLHNWCCLTPEDLRTGG